MAFLPEESFEVTDFLPEETFEVTDFSLEKTFIARHVNQAKMDISVALSKSLTGIIGNSNSQDIASEAASNKVDDSKVQAVTKTAGVKKAQKSKNGKERNFFGLRW
eukprot:809902_1